MTTTLKERLVEKALYGDCVAQGVDSNGIIRTVVQDDGVFYLLSENMDVVTHKPIDMERVVTTIGMVHQMESV